MRKRARNPDSGRLIDAAPIGVPEPPTYDDIRALARAVHIPHSASTPYRDGWADGYAAAVSDARSASGDRDTDPGTDRAEVDAFTDRAAHNIATAVVDSRAHHQPVRGADALAGDYAKAYELAVDRLRSVAADRGRSGPDSGRDSDGGAS